MADDRQRHGREDGGEHGAQHERDRDDTPDPDGDGVALMRAGEHPQHRALEGPVEAGGTPEEPQQPQDRPGPGAFGHAIHDRGRDRREGLDLADDRRG